MSNWQSTPIKIDGFEVRVDAGPDGVDLGKVSGGVYASDLLLTSEQARSIACALIEGADKSDEAARGQA